MKIKKRKKLTIKKRSSASASLAIPTVAPVSDQQRRAIESKMLEELLWARRIHETQDVDQKLRITRGLTPAQFTVFDRRMEQIHALTDVGKKSCTCRKCAGTCPVKIYSESLIPVCYECTFGRHGGVSTSASTTATTAATEKKKHEHSDSTRRTKRTIPAKPTIPPVSARPRLRIPKRKR